jgi:hypothetical protein
MRPSVRARHPGIDDLFSNLGMPARGLTDFKERPRDRAAVSGFSARKRSRAAEAAVLSLPDRAARYRACQAVEAIEKSHRGADGSSISLRRQ